MRMKKFESKLRRDMFRFSMLTITIMIAFTLIIFGLHSVNVRKAQLHHASSDYSSSIERSIRNYENLLFKTNEETFIDFIEKDVNRNRVFDVFYSFNSHESLKSDLLILNPSYEVMFSTNSVLTADNAFLHYIKIIMGKIEPSDTSMQTRVYHSINGEKYILHVFPFQKYYRINGYGISIINGKEIQSLPIDSTVDYVIYDNFNRIVSTNSVLPIRTNRGKVNFNFFLENQNQFIHRIETNQRSIGDNLMIMTFQQFDSYLSVLYRTLAGFALVIVIVVLHSYYFSHKISENTGRSLHKINLEMEKVKQNYNHLIHIKTDDEFEVLASGINNMLQKLILTSHENMKLSQLNLEAEKRKLDAQFNPHFLANTLESIRSSMYLDTGIANRLILQINKILRYSIDEEQSEITLQEDIEYIKHFLEINATRLEDFSYEIDIQPELNNLVVPKLFLLPFVENSLQYGYKNRRDLFIKISIKKENDAIQVKVIDNGRALTDEKAAQINEALNQPHKLANHHGLKNTKQRLELFYDYSTLTIHTKGEFTIIDILIKDDDRYV